MNPKESQAIKEGLEEYEAAIVDKRTSGCREPFDEETGNVVQEVREKVPWIIFLG